MVVIQKLRELDRSRWFDQVVGALLSNALSPLTLALGLWLLGFVSMPGDMKEVKAGLAKVTAAQEAETSKREAADTSISHRMDMADEMHQKIIEEHREIRQAIPYAVGRTYERGRREGAAR